ncbi:hypothetical protein B0H19DRAFT_966984, partial [Mycena capillaripes]
MSERDLYSRLLLAKGHGYPLSYPQPLDDLPPESRKGTEIGDVGILTRDGTFDVFFNICRGRDDPANRFGVPVGFETVDLHHGDVTSMISYHPPGSHFSNKEIRKRPEAIVEISTVAKQAAFLLMPDGASQSNLRFLDKFRQQGLKHAQNWYAFLKSLRCMVENGELYLITGVDKSPSWSVAVVEKNSQDCNISL